MGWFFKLLEMTLMSSLFQQVSNIGIIVLIVVFQPEIRQFLILLGAAASKSRNIFLRRLFQLKPDLDFSQQKNNLVQEVKSAMLAMSDKKTGALILLANEDHVSAFRSTGVRLDSRISQLILESIFEKNSPMHDGATVILNNRIYAASCILPLSYNTNLPLKYGLRHRAAIGISEVTDVHAFVISEESGHISHVYRGKIVDVTEESKLVSALEKYSF